MLGRVFIIFICSLRDLMLVDPGKKSEIRFWPNKSKLNLMKSRKDGQWMPLILSTECYKENQQTDWVSMEDMN